jgi:hypothetical protein
MFFQILLNLNSLQSPIWWYISYALEKVSLNKIQKQKTPSTASKIYADCHSCCVRVCESNNWTQMVQDSVQSGLNTGSQFLHQLNNQQFLRKSKWDTNVAEHGGAGGPCMCLSFGQNIKIPPLYTVPDSAKHKLHLRTHKKYPGLHL